MDKFSFQTALAQKTDISCVQAFHTYAEIECMIEAAIKYHFAAVFTLPAFSSYVAKKLCLFPEIHTGGVISFPSGGDTSIQKMRQAAELLEAGCQELDMVMNLTAFKSQEYGDVVQDIIGVRRQSDSAILKVIIETCLLTDEEKIALCKCVSDSGADFIKTSTGFSKAGATRENVSLMASHVTDGTLVKAAGGIASLEDAADFIALGASRLGTSRVVAAVKEGSRK